jgi:hypothetical protein
MNINLFIRANSKDMSQSLRNMFQKQATPESIAKNVLKCSFTDFLLKILSLNLKKIESGTTFWNFFLRFN